MLTKYFGFLAAFLWFLTASLKPACEQAHLCEFRKIFRGGAASANIFPQTRISEPVKTLPRKLAPIFQAYT